MSVKIMAEVWKLDIPTVPKMVLLALADCSNDEGECYPSISTLMKKTSLAERTVFKYINELEKQGYITRKHRTGRSTVYFLSNPCTTCTPAPYAPLHHVHPTPARGAPPPLHHVHPTPAPRAPLTIIEPSLEPSSEPSLITHAERAQKKKGSRLPEDWTLPDEWYDWAAKHRPEATEQEIRTVADSFSDYWQSKAGKDATKTDWRKTWQNWVRNESRILGKSEPPNSKPPGRFQQPTMAEKVAAAKARLAKQVTDEPEGTIIEGECHVVR